MSDNESQKVTQVKRKLIIQELLVRKAMMVSLSTQWVFPLSKEIVEKDHLRIPRKLSIVQKTTMGGTCRGRATRVEAA